MTKRFPNLEPATGYDGYIDYQDAVTYDYTDDLFESDRDYDQELETEDWQRI